MARKNNHNTYTDFLNSNYDCYKNKNKYGMNYQREVGGICIH